MEKLRLLPETEEIKVINDKILLREKQIKDIAITLGEYNQNLIQVLQIERPSSHFILTNEVLAQNKELETQHQVLSKALEEKVAI